MVNNEKENVGIAGVASRLLTKLVTISLCRYRPDASVLGIYIRSRMKYTPERRAQSLDWL